MNHTKITKKNEGEWFGEWFDSHFYHILYKHRDFAEAQLFIDNLTKKLDFLPQHHILDLACGKGRFAVYLNQKGFEVTGIDLSEQNIIAAQRYANQRLHFWVGDMRKLDCHIQYDFILNMFTSFGYFQQDQENFEAIQSMANCLKKGGKLVLDFFNTPKVLAQLPAEEQKTIDDICFRSQKYLQQDCIIKDIRFESQGVNYHFQERVKAIQQQNFEAYFQQAGLQIKAIWGNYELQDYCPDAERMIFLVEK